MGMTWEQVCRRAGARRQYNALRHMRKILRRWQVVDHWGRSNGRHGWQTEAARAIGVHRSVITRDMRAIVAELNREGKCPLCGSRVRVHPVSTR